MTEDRLKDDIEAVHNRSIGHLLWQVSRLFRETLSESIGDSGLHMGKVLILATLRAQRDLNRGDRLTQAELGRITGIEKSSLVIFLDGLEQDGWVKRLRHPKDRRAHIIHLTDDGAHRFETVGLALYRQQQDNLSALTPAEQDQLLVLLARLRSDLAARRS